MTCRIFDFFGFLWKEIELGILDNVDEVFHGNRGKVGSGLILSILCNVPL